MSAYELVPWCTPAEVLATPALRALATADPPGVTVDNPALVEACIGATEFLHSRTWHRFTGTRDVEMRPCCEHRWYPPGSTTTWRSPLMLAASGDAWPILQDAAECGCTYMTTMVLPSDVRAVNRVMLDGELFTDWRIDNGRLLVRTDGEGWPYCSDVISPDTEPDTWSLHVTVGEEPITLARMAARELAGELFLADADPSSCRIPTRISTVNRQGATYTRVDTTTIGKDGMLGLRLTDIFLSQFGKRRRRIEIASPEMPARGPRRVGAGPA